MGTSVGKVTIWSIITIVAIVVFALLLAHR
jgi:hypothetical protein